MPITRSELLRELNNDIETGLEIYNGRLQLCLAENTHEIFDNDIEKLIEIAQTLGVDTSKYNRKEG